MAFSQSAEDAYSFDTTPANFRQNFSNDFTFYKENLPNQPNSLPNLNQTFIPNSIDQPYHDIFLFTNYREKRKFSLFPESINNNNDSFSIYNPGTYEIQFSDFNKFSFNNCEYHIKQQRTTNKEFTAEISQFQNSPKLQFPISHQQPQHNQLVQSQSLNNQLKETKPDILLTQSQRQDYNSTLSHTQKNNSIHPL